jgi:hypothetical protein
MRGIRIQDLLTSEEKPSAHSAGKGGSPPRLDPTSSETQYFVVEFIHDTICPFCYIGMKNLFTAIDIYKLKYPNAIFEVTCTPFILAPTAKPSCKFLCSLCYVKGPSTCYILPVWFVVGCNAY